MALYDEPFVYDLDQAEAEIAEVGCAQVQFSQPLSEQLHVLTLNKLGEQIEGPRISRSKYLERLNRMCKSHGPNLQIRFYGHYSDVFDGKILETLPNIESLMINCLYEAENLEVISGLERLKSLQLGIYDLKDKSLLSKIPLENLDYLTLEETATKALDLAPLSRCRSLKTLRLFGHKKNIEATGSLCQLREFAFNPAKGKPLDFINGMTSLKELKFVLGGVESVNEVNLPKLKDIAFTMVRGLKDVGDLQRFSSLERFFMQDQPHVERIKTGSKNKKLKHFWFYNCPELKKLEGCGNLPSLRSLHGVKTGLQLNQLKLPASLTHLSVYSGKAKQEKSEREAILARKLNPEPHPSMPFFYK